MDKFLNFKKINDSETELYIYGDIRKKDIIDKWFGTGEDVTEAFSLKEALAIVDTPNLTVRINSYGGSVSEGLAIYGLLSDFKGHLKTIVDGFACSAASIIFMAGQERVVPENGLLMIHNAWTEARGDANAMKKVAEDLEKITQPSLSIYTSKTNLSEEEIKEKMDREEWITSKEAYEWGFSTTQTKKDSVMQSLEADYVYNLVMKNKALQNAIEEKAKEMASKILEEQCKGSAIKEPTGLLNSNHIKEDAWMSFFYTKKQEKEGKKDEN